MMNILLLSQVFPPEHAPGGVNVSELAEDLAKEGHHVTVITDFPSHPDGPLYPGWKAKFIQVEETPQGYRLIRCRHSYHRRTSITWKIWHYFTFAISSFIGGMWAGGKADVLFSYSTPLFGEFSALLLAKFKGAKNIYWLNDVNPEASRNAGILRDDGLAYRVSLAIDTFVCRHATVVATLTEPMRKMLLARGLAPDKVIILRHWVDPSKIVPDNRNNYWRQKQGIPLDKFVVLSAGTIGYISGAEIIIEAAVKLRDREDIYFLIVGDGPVKGTLIDKTQEYGLKNVKFLPFQPAEVLSEVQATGDVGLVTLLPTTGESSIPSKMHGYTAAARPVIASVADDTPTADMVREGQFGLVCPSQDVVALVDAIRRLADNPTEASQMGERSRQFFVNNFGRDECVHKVIDVIKSLNS